MLYHISTEVSLQEKVFTPRIPNFRLDGEDNQLKRICVSNSIRNCISSFPYKNEVMWGWRTRPVFLSVYEVDNQDFSNGEIKRPEEILDKVSDALEKQEHWILKEFSAVPSLIKIKRLNFSNLCKYTNHYSGNVTELEYEKEIEQEDRVGKATFYHNKFYKEFQKACLKNEIEIQEVSVTKEHMDYFGCIPSSREFSVHRVTYRIPAGASAKSAWVVILKELRKNKRKQLVYTGQDFA